jgi:hypothetical protein
MFSPSSLLCAFVLLCAALGIAQAKTPRAQLTAADRQLFAWFDELGIEDMSRARLVRLRTGNVVRTISDGVEKRLSDEPRAYLLWEKDNQFRALLGDLTVATFEKQGTDPAQDDYVGWRAVAPEEETASMRKLISQKEIDGFWIDGHDTYSDRLDQRAQAFVLARYFQLQHREDLAASLLHGLDQWAHKTKEAPLHEFLEDKICSVLRWRATLAWADPQQDRHALAALLRNAAKHCPKAYDATFMAKPAEALEQMASEDDTHRRLGAEELERLSPAEQARELVFQLRDDNQNEEEMWPRPWPFEPTRGNGSMHKLKALGLAAVPALLGALKDDRPTRSVYRSHRYGGGAWPSMVRDLASQALTEIAGVNFFWFLPGGGLEYEERWTRMRAIAEDWWKTTEKEGDLTWLRAHVVAGADGAQHCLEAISKRHPDAMPQLALEVIPTITNPRARADMLQQLKKVNTPEVNAFLLDELNHGPTLGNRTVAAYLLRQRHQPEAMAVMLAELSRFPGKIGEDKIGEHRSNPLADGISSAWGPPISFDAPMHVLEFLTSSDSPPAIREVQAVLPRCDRFWRSSLIQACAMRFSGIADDRLEPVSRETRRALEMCLISELADEEILENSTFNGTKNPKLAEVAANALSGCFPDKYHFEIAAPPEKRAAQLAAVRTRADTEAKRSPVSTEPER